MHIIMETEIYSAMRAKTFLRGHERTVHEKSAIYICDQKRALCVADRSDHYCTFQRFRHAVLMLLGGGGGGGALSGP